MLCCVGRQPRPASPGYLNGLHLIPYPSLLLAAHLSFVFLFSCSFALWVVFSLANSFASFFLIASDSCLALVVFSNKKEVYQDGIVDKFSLAV
eukprot:m.82396 g.82396  ORF g.82396 m.82396 type:complete len:93 (-) comp14293_c0_seq4:2838-3116(-)